MDDDVELYGYEYIYPKRYQVQQFDQVTTVHDI